MNSNSEMGRQLMVDMHKDLLQDFRERERGIWQIWTIMLTAAGSWILALGKYLGKHDTSSMVNSFTLSLGKYSLVYGKSKAIPSQSFYALVAAKVFALALIHWGMNIIYTFGYHYRMFQITLFKIEEKGGLVGKKVIDNDWDPCQSKKKGDEEEDKYKLDLPRLYKVHAWTFCIVSCLITVALPLVAPNSNLMTPLVWSICAANVVLLSFFYYLSRRSLKKLYEKNCLNC